MESKERAGASPAPTQRGRGNLSNPSCALNSPGRKRPALKGRSGGRRRQPPCGRKNKRAFSLLRSQTGWPKAPQTCRSRRGQLDPAGTIGGGEIFAHGHFALHLILNPSCVLNSPGRKRPALKGRSGGRRRQPPCGRRRQPPCGRKKKKALLLLRSQTGWPQAPQTCRSRRGLDPYAQREYCTLALTGGPLASLPLGE